MPGVYLNRNIPGGAGQELITHQEWQCLWGGGGELHMYFQTKKI